jgi:hypothetical protein
MAQKFWFYRDFGGGFTEISTNDISINTQLVWRRGEINDFISRKALEGNFMLKNGEFTAAKTHFITNGNEEAAIEIYENGNSGSGVLVYEGFIRISGNWDSKRSVVTFEEFRSVDIYTDILAKLKNSYIGENLIGFSPFSYFGTQGQNTNANKLHALTWDGTNFSITAGTPFSFPNLGRCAVQKIGSEINIFDNVSNTLTSYVISSGQWSQVRSASVPISNFRYSNCTIALTSSITFDLIADNGDVIVPVTYSGGSSYTFGTAVFTEDLKFPSACWTGARIAIVDEEQRKIRTGNNSIDVDEVKRPQVCIYDEATEQIAFIDARLGNLQMYQYSGGAYSKVGNPLYISGLLAPAINRYFPTGDIMLHDTLKGTLEMYTFSGTDWSQVGNTFSLGGGYMSGVAQISTDIMVAISDTYTFTSSIMSSYYNTINSLLLQNAIWGAGSGLYELQSSGNGATVDVNNLNTGVMSDLVDNEKDRPNLNRYKYSLDDSLKWYELFENYWYIDEVSGAYKIKFTQPDLFSTFGTDIDITSLGVSLELEQRDYKEGFIIDQEELLFNNANGADFDGNIVDYQRNSSVLEQTPYPFSTDFEYIIEIFTGESLKKIETGGLFLFFSNDISGAKLALSGTGIKSGADIKNYLMSQSQIYNDYWDTYRYKEQGNILINGSSTPVGNSVRDIIEYASVQFSESDAGLTEFPGEPASLIWGGGIPNSFIMELVYDMDTRIYTARSRIHDI